MFLVNVERVLTCGRSQMAGLFFAGYHSVHPLSSEELEVLPVLVAPRFCQSLLCGAFISKHVDPGNEYILETTRGRGATIMNGNEPKQRQNQNRL